MDLRERLRLDIRGAGFKARPSNFEPRTSNIEHLAQTVETAHGVVHVADEWWPANHCHGRLALHDALSLEDAGLCRLTTGLPTGQAGVDALHLAGAAFLDVETTGLVGGTGTYVFLVGLGTFEDDAFRLRQFFLAGLDGERAMLASVAEVLAACRAVVSFNGRRFDLPLLETRLILNRLPHPCQRLPHLDLLYPARRIYRGRLPSCRLAALESALLGVEREDDVPGWAIPALYFDYLRAGTAGPLRAVFKHNALDILSLVTLTAHLGALAAGSTPRHPEDVLALGRWDESDGRLVEAARLYRAALDGGLCGEPRLHARYRLAHLCRRLGRWEEAERVWREQAYDGGPMGRRLEALVELAKLEEHRRRDYAAAEALTRRALSLLEVAALSSGQEGACLAAREALEHRLWRLRRRQGER